MTFWQKWLDNIAAVIFIVVSHVIFLALFLAIPGIVVAAYQARDAMWLLLYIPWTIIVTGLLAWFG